ncbi:hypothetical protein [Sphingomonas endophytica]|uniref:Lipoprotein n=1 Tax=Sphingomonas endophytica TaxID=869719 RepID=A0A147I4V2_9SPHN|nr:hypothetical protein [Sphingomonas endophytica]KTT73548.1 hypothetical protein NS334_07385 [Sphingomonas endophytica]
MTMRFLIAAPLALAACAQPAPSPSATPSARVDDAPVVRPNPADAAATEERYLGRWIGVEGMFLNVTRRQGGGVAMEMQWDLDHRGTFDGSVTAEGLRFVRNGVAETAVPGAGDATGLKWLAGKKDCLIVKPGEGYCRE